MPQCNSLRAPPPVASAPAGRAGARAWRVWRAWRMGVAPPALPLLWLLWLLWSINARGCHFKHLFAYITDNTHAPSKGGRDSFGGKLMTHWQFTKYAINHAVAPALIYS